MTLQFEDIPLTKIHAHPHNVRTELGDLTELIESIKAQGILLSLTVTPHPSVKGAYLLIAGHRRLAAARLAKLRTAPCMVNTSLDTETAQLEAMLVENLQRVDISPMEEARAYQYLLELPDYDVARLAKSTGRSQRLVKERVKLGKLPDGQAASLHDGTLTIERALVLVDFADDPEAVEQLERIPARDHSTWEVQVKQLQRLREWKAGLPKLRKELADEGITLIDAPEGPAYSWSEYYVTQTQYQAGQDALSAGYDHAVVDAVTQHPWAGMDKVIWLKKRSVRAAEAPPEASPEELAKQERRQNITAALAIAAEVREAHVLEQIKKTSHATARAAMEALVIDHVPVPRIAWAVGMHWNQDVDAQEYIDALPKLTLEQLVMLLHFNHVEHEANLLTLSGWDRRPYWHEEQAGLWLSALTGLYGYTLSDPEKEALAYWPAPEPEEDEGAGDADAA